MANSIEQLRSGITEVMLRGDQTELVAKETVAQLEAILSKQTTTAVSLFLVEIDKVAKTTEAARESAANFLTTQKRLKVAVVTKNIFLRSIAKLIIAAVPRPKQFETVAFFTTRRSALKWLEAIAKTPQSHV